MSRVMTAAEAICEARRCLQCANPMCRKGCPIENNIPEFNKHLSQGNIGAAYETISVRSNLPAICGRVCPHEKQCESHCILSKKGQGIQIGSLEMFIADFSQDNEIKVLKPSKKDKGRVAVIGSGPAGITCAADLAKMDFDVTIYEAFEEPGGVLMFGIPEFRLAKRVVRREINELIHLGVKIECNKRVGKDFTIDDIFALGYDAVFMGTGTSKSNILDIPGKDLQGVLTATDFLHDCVKADNEAGAADVKILPENAEVIVVGAGNVAMDAARSALRRGAKRVNLVYRKTEKEVAAFPQEFKAAKEEGIQVNFLMNPAEYISKKQVNDFYGVEGEAGDAEKLAAVKLEINEKVEEGKFRATGKYKIMNCDVLILAVGQKPGGGIVSITPSIEVDKGGYIITRNRPYGMTTRTGVFSSGDVVHGPATVVLAMKESKKVAQGIADYVEAKRLLEDCDIL